MDEARRAQLAAYVDGELPPEEARAVLQWLDAHPEALRGVEEARRVLSLLGLYEDEVVPEGFADRVLAAVGAGSAEAGVGAASAGGGAAPRLTLLRGRFSRVAAVAAAILLAVGVGTYVGRHTLEAPETPSATVAALEAVPAELLENGDLAKLSQLFDDDFEALLAGDPEELAKQAKGDGG